MNCRLPKPTADSLGLRILAETTISILPIWGCKVALPHRAAQGTEEKTNINSVTSVPLCEEGAGSN